MKKILNILIIILIVISPNLLAVDFDKYFQDETFRIDYHHTGDSKTEILSIDRLYRYGIWAGNPKYLIDEFNNGAYYLRIYDEATGELIYSKGFDSYFKEYQTSLDAQEGIIKSFHESALIPFPKSKIKFTLWKRDKFNELAKIYSIDIDPADNSVIKENIYDPEVVIFKPYDNSTPHTSLDVVILGEGYTKSEIVKFKNDTKKFADILRNHPPFNHFKSKINVYGILKPSLETGSDEPRAGIYKNTSLNTTFNSMGSERYLLTEDNKSLRDVAGHVPYDAVFIIVNHTRYGGGGIYNFYCTFTSDNQWHKYLILHEFGHSFAGLADEYYTSSTAFNDFYPKGVEPVEPNITALNNPNNIKWKESLTQGISIPTIWEKKKFDVMDLEWQKERKSLNDKTALLKRDKASKELILKAESDYDSKDLAHSIEVDKYLKSTANYGKVGVFEGAGYVSEGLFRPMIDCLMFSKGNKPYCKVCEKAVEKVIKHYVE